MSLKQAVDVAKENNANLKIAEYGIASSDYLIKQARGNFLPSLSLSGSYNRNISKQVIFLPSFTGGESMATELGSDNDFSSSLQLSLPLFSKYNGAYKNYSLLQKDYSKELKRGQQLSIINAVKKAYSSYLIALEIVSVQQSQLDNHKINLSNIEQKLRHGSATEFEQISAKVKIASSQNNLLTAKSNLLPIANQLKLLLGVNPSIEIVPTDAMEMLDFISQPVATNTELLNNNSTVKQMKLDIDAKESQVQLTKSSLYPTISAVGSYYYQTQANDFKFKDYNWVNTSLVGLQLSYSIFNGNITKNKIEQAKIDKLIAQEQIDYTLNEYQLQSIMLLSKLDFSLQKVAVQKENMVLTEQALYLIKKSFDAGVGTLLEVNDAELSYTQARLSWLQSISDYNDAQFDYQLLMGQE